MQEKHLYEYAVIRVVPRVEREEFLNVGVIVYCPSQRFLKAAFGLDLERLRAFGADLDKQVLEEHLHVFDLICQGNPLGGTIGKLPISSRFHWLTATRSTIIQTSPVHLGLCLDPQATLERLYAQLVK